MIIPTGFCDVHIIHLAWKIYFLGYTLPVTGSLWNVVVVVEVVIVVFVEILAVVNPLVFGLRVVAMIDSLEVEVMFETFPAVLVFNPEIK